MKHMRTMLLPTFVASVLLILFSVPNAHAYSSFDIKDQASCQSLPSGSTIWDSTTSTCTVTNISLVLDSGNSLTVESGISLKIISGTIDNIGGTINNSGSIYNTGGVMNNFYMINNSGNISNAGTINNNGTIDNSGNLYNNGTINNTGDINISGTMTNSSGSTINNSGTMANSGSIDNAGGIIYTSDEIDNNGMLDNSGIIANSGTIRNGCEGTITGNPITGNPVVNTCVATYPTLTITVPANNTKTNSDTVTVSGTSSDGTSVSSVTWKVDSGKVSTATGTTSWSFNTGNLPDGIHTIYVNSTNSAGLVTQKHVGITVDTSSPAVTGTANMTANANGWYHHPLQVSWTGTDASGIASCDSPTAYSGPDGNSITITGHCTDNTGNVGNGTMTINYDSTPPILAIPSNVTMSSTSSAGAVVTFSGTNGTAASATDATSGVYALTYSPPSHSTFPIGTTTVTVTATDKAGNKATGTFTVTIQSTLRQTKSNIVSSLKALSPADKDDSHAIDDAIKKITASTGSTLWLSDNELDPKQGQKAFDLEKESVHKLMDVIKRGKESATFDGTIRVAINGVVTIDDTIASQAIDKAKTIHDKDAQHHVLEAQKEMQAASGDLSKGHFDNAIDHYKNAWNKAQEALKVGF